MTTTLNSKLSSAELCRSNGWGRGTILVGDEGRGPEQITITAVGYDEILAVEHADPGSHFYGEGPWCLHNRDWRETRPVTPTKATHWSASLDPEEWTDDPSELPEDAARELIESRDDDRGSDIRDDLSRSGSPVEVTVHGYVNTDYLDATDEDDDSDASYIGRDWFVPTGETVTVVCEINYHVKETK